jgi:uncharacterized protein YicC (UPF0701 family)
MNREKLKQDAKDSIDTLFSKIEELEKKKDSVKEEYKAKYDEKIKELKSKKADLQIKYETLIASTEEKWKEAQVDFSAAADSIKAGFSKITGLFK